jgi:hypothetical protein
MVPAGPLAWLRMPAAHERITESEGVLAAPVLVAAFGVGCPA